MTVLTEKLKSFDYYKNKLPMYLRSSDGFVSHFEIWYDLLAGQNKNGVVNVCDTILNLLNIFDAYLQVVMRQFLFEFPYQYFHHKYLLENF